MKGRVAAGVGLAVLGLLLAAVGLRGAGAQVHATAHGRVNTDRPATLNAHNSPAAAADPAHPQVVIMADRIDTPSPSCSVALSADGGASWRGVPLPLAAGAVNCFWPDVAWNGAGEALVLFGATEGPNNQPAGLWVQRFKGRTPVGPTVTVAGLYAFNPRLAAEGDRVVATWVQTGRVTEGRTLGFALEPNPVMAAVSTDGGRTFGPPVRVSEPARKVAVPDVVVGGDGTVVVSALDLGDDDLDYSGLHNGQGGPPAKGQWHVVTWTSTDGGTTFAPGSTVADVVIPQRVLLELNGPRPGLARDPRHGRLYATWESGAGRRRDVFIASSDDRGRTWSTPVPVVVRPGTQTLPAVAVAPDGRVDVVFYDRSGDPADIQTEVAQASSWDGGRSFTTATISSRDFDSRIGLGSFQGIPVLGDQTAVVAGAARSVALWSDTSRATRDDNKQDLSVGVVGEHGPGAVRVGVLTVGVVFVLAAAAVTAAGVRRRVRRPSRQG